jgi:tripartite ATP-independent transporter DctM subunit
MDISIIVAFVILFTLLFMGVQIGVCMATAGIVGAYLFTGSWLTGINMLRLQAIEISASYTLMVIPMFIILGSLGAVSGITTDLYTAFYRWLGRVPGGIAVATIGTCAGMGAITGSSVAVAAAMTRIALPHLRRYGYQENLSVGCVTMGGTLAIMIPPSVTFVLFGIFSEQSIGKLLIAGLLPGILLSTLFSVMIIGRCILNPKLGPRGPKFSWKERFDAIIMVIPFVSIVLAILIGILFGVWTPIESGAGGAILVVLLSIWRKSVNMRSLIRAFREGAILSSSILLVIIGAMTFGQFLALQGFTDMVVKFISSLGLSRFELFSVFVGIYVILGCVMEVTSILALTVPLVMPIVLGVGWDPIWFGVIVVFMMEIAAVTPPVGLNLYAVRAVDPSISLSSVFYGALPFWLVTVICVYIVYSFPQIALMLPRMMLGQ